MGGHSPMSGVMLLVLCAAAAPQRGGAGAALVASNSDVGTCNLCAHEWTFVLSTGRSGSTSLLDALNALPGVQLSGENGASLLGAMDMYLRARESATSGTVSDGARMHGAISEQQLLCSLQEWFVLLEGSSITTSGSVPSMRGFKELLLNVGGRDFKREVIPELSQPQPEANMTTLDEMSHAAANFLHLPATGGSHEAWHDFLTRLFPCARVVWSVRRDTRAQANSAFHQRFHARQENLDLVTQEVYALHRVCARTGLTHWPLTLATYTVHRAHSRGAGRTQ